MMELELEVLRNSFHSISEEKDSDKEENNSEDTEKNIRTAQAKKVLLFMKTIDKKKSNYLKSNEHI